jgi:hypothetical protein
MAHLPAAPRLALLRRGVGENLVHNRGELRRTMSPTSVVILGALLLFIASILYRISGQLDDIWNRLDEGLPRGERDEEDREPPPPRDE